MSLCRQRFFVAPSGSATMIAAGVVESVLYFSSVRNEVPRERREVKEKDTIATREVEKADGERLRSSGRSNRDNDNSDPKETKGGFNDENMAARAHDLAVLKIYGTSASLNFPVTEYEEEMEEMKDMSKDEYLKSLKKRPTNGDPFKMKWEAKLKRAGSFKGVYLGRCVLMAATELVAARAHDIAAIKVWGRKAITNFDIGQYVFRGILESPLLPIRKGIFSQIANDDLQRLSSENRANSPADFDYDQPGNNAADEGF
ncbi:AP2-like ethylene-responsive transcription factor BBM2 [Linum perenne]